MPLSWPEGPWGLVGKQAHRGGAPRGLCQPRAVCSGLGIRVCAKVTSGRYGGGGVEERVGMAARVFSEGQG